MDKLSLMEKAKKIKLLILDVDGVLTDGSLYIGDNQECFKAFHVHDGLGLRLLLSTKVLVAVITAKESAIVPSRLNPLGIFDIHQGVKNKLKVYETLLKNHQLTDEQVAYIGDDIPDYQALSRAGLSICVNNAHPLVKRGAHMITGKAGGQGAVREVCDFIMQSQDTLDNALAPYGSLFAHD